MKLMTPLTVSYVKTIIIYLRTKLYHKNQHHRKKRIVGENIQ